MTQSRTRNLRKTKANTAAEYTRRINKAFEFIEKNLDQTIRLDDVARASHFSSYHFHRIFHALVDETVNEYISRKRMEKAAKRLIFNPALSVTEVAEVGGFSSSANFAKAFKLYFGVSATELRKGSLGTSESRNHTNNSKVGKLYSKYGKAFNPQDLYSQSVTQSVVFDRDKLEELLMKIKVEDKQQIPIAFLSSPNGYELSSISDTWDKMVNWAKMKGIECSQQIRFGICHDNPLITPVEKCCYDAAIKINSEVEVAPPYNKSVIPSGKYAVAYYKDLPEKISSFMTELCSHWFPDSGYEPDDYPPVFHYLNDSRQDGFVEMDVYIKVKELELS